MYYCKYAHSGMTFHRLPLFVWAVLNSSIVVVILPVLAVLLQCY